MARRNSSAFARLRALTAPPSSWAVLDEDPVQAQAFTRERKLEIAQRSTRAAHRKVRYIRAESYHFRDPLVFFPAATGDENYIGGAVETIEGIRLIKQRIPHVRTVLGISNVSFGLPPGAREVVNSVFLYYCTKAGLDLAIVNAERIERFPSIPEHERLLAENLLFNRVPGEIPSGHPQASFLQGAPDDWRAQTREQKAAINQFHIAAVSAHFRGAGIRKKARAEDLPLDRRLSNYILEGSKDGLIGDLNLKLQEGVAPLNIINGPLMDGMSEVGRLFNNNELIVAEVLQSAEAMKTAVSHLETFMEKADVEKRARVILATVKGDVHDIGKNLVEIILKNNGYDVINLGIKVPPEDLIRAHREHHPDAIGLSGLLVKSAQQMVTTAADLREAGIRVPLLVGGAALSEKFTRMKIAPQYSTAVCWRKRRDDRPEFDEPVKRSGTPRRRFGGAYLHRDARRRRARAAHSQRAGGREIAGHSHGSANPERRLPDRKVRAVPDVNENWSHINPYMLFGRHLGFRGDFEKALAERDARAIELFNNMEDVKRQAATFMKISAVWQFFEAERRGNSIALFEPGGASPLHTFHFQRQHAGGKLCLSDYLLPARDGSRDHIALFVVTAGAGIRTKAEEAKVAGSYFFSHGLQALALETAEACAEWLHRRIREDWGFPDPPAMTMPERFDVAVPRQAL